MDVYSAATRSRVMSCIGKTDTQPELRVRRLLHRCGCRFRLHRHDLPGVPDIVLPRYKTVVFVHGCFWHQHSCPLGKLPKSNRAYWIPKLTRNHARDRASRRLLRQLGWTVLVVWECQTSDSDALLRQLAPLLKQAKEHRRKARPNVGKRRGEARRTSRRNRCSE